MAEKTPDAKIYEQMEREERTRQQRSSEFFSRATTNFTEHLSVALTLAVLLVIVTIFILRVSGRNISLETGGAFLAISVLAASTYTLIQQTRWSKRVKAGLRKAREEEELKANPHKRIRVVLANGKTGTIEAKDFDPDTMRRL